MSNSEPVREEVLNDAVYEAVEYLEEICASHDFNERERLTFFDLIWDYSERAMIHDRETMKGLW